MKIIKRLLLWGKTFGNKHKWFSFISSLAFVGLALFRIEDDMWIYAPLVILGILVVITFPTDKRSE